MAIFTSLYNVCYFNTGQIKINYRPKLGLIIAIYWSWHFVASFKDHHYYSRGDVHSNLYKSNRAWLLALPAFRLSAHRNLLPLCAISTNFPTLFHHQCSADAKAFGSRLLLQLSTAIWVIRYRSHKLSLRNWQQTSSRMHKKLRRKTMQWKSVIDIAINMHAQHQWTFNKNLLNSGHI